MATDKKNMDAYFTQEHGLTSKGAYLAFRNDLKAAIRLMAAENYAFGKAMRQKGGDETAQMKRAYNKPRITHLIALRRAAKTWSWQKAQEGKGAQQAA
jgi:hypothetical protein